MRHIKKLMIAILMSIQVFSLSTMAQDATDKANYIVVNMANGIKPGLRGQLIKGTIALSQEVNLQAGDTFVLGFYKEDVTSANDMILFEEIPQIKMVYKGKVLVENEDFNIALQEGQIVVQLKCAIEGNVEISIEHLVVVSRLNLDRNYYLILEAHHDKVKEKINIQRVPIDYGYFGTLGGRITFTAGSQSCEVEEEPYKMRGIAYQDASTGQMMVPLKDTLMALGTIEKNMYYSKGTFEAWVPLKHTFKVGSKVVLDGEENAALTRPVILKDDIMYIGLEDFAKIFGGSVLKNEQSPESQLLHVPVSMWLENKKK